MLFDLRSNWNDSIKELSNNKTNLNRTTKVSKS